MGGWLKQNGANGVDVSDRIALRPFLEDEVSPSSGPADAETSIVVFTDFQCPACRAAHPEMLNAVTRDENTRIIYRDLPVFGDISDRAARVALAARNQRLYPQMHDAFMRERETLTDPVMRRIVRGLGGDWQQIERDLVSDSEIEATIERNRTDALRLGVSGTPTYLIGNYRIVGAMDEGEFARAIERARETADSVD